MNTAIEAVGLGKRYGRRWALSGCSLSIPAGRVVGLVGPNGAGKSTLLHLTVGLLTPTAGSISVLGGAPGAGPSQLQKVGFLAQESPVYARMTVAQHLDLGRWLNPGWAAEFASARIADLGLDPAQRAGSLSGGQRAQLALTLAIAKRPELLVLDEPVAALDPLVRWEFLQTLMTVVAEQGIGVVLSSHLIADLERVCDHFVVLVSGQVALAGDVDDLLATHHRLTGPRRDPARVPSDQTVIAESQAEKQTTLLVRTDQPILDPAWSVSAVSLDDLVLAYMRQARDGAPGQRTGPGGGPMIRVAWLQARSQTLVAYGLLLALAIAALVTGIQLSHLYDSLVAPCAGGSSTRLSGCGLAIQHFLDSQGFMQSALDILARAVPALLGVFWGAPLLAREYETGTFRLAWTQSVPRSRWLLTRIGLGALATLVLAGLFSLTVTWWYASRDKVDASAYAVFDRRDIAPIAYALFAFAAGVMFGAIIRRTVPAMAATIGLFVLVRIAITEWVRPNLLAAKHAVVSLAREGSVQLGIGQSNGGPLRIFASGGGPPGSWTQASHLVDLTGHRLSSAQMTAFMQQHCARVLDPGPTPAGTGPVPSTDPGALCLDEVTKSFKLAVSYQPAGRYWIFQWLEAGIFVALAGLAAWMAFWWVTRRTH